MGNAKITLTLSYEQLNVVLAGLQELQFKHAAPVFDAIIKQVQPPQELPKATSGEEIVVPAPDC